MDQRWGSKCHRLFLELFNVLVQAPKRGQPLKDRPISVAFYDTHGDRYGTFSTYPSGTPRVFKQAL